MDYLPLFARLTDTRCLVVGGGPVGLRKARQLLRAKAQVTVLAEHYLPELTTMADQGQLQLQQGKFHAADIADHRLIVAATDDHAVNASVADAAAAAGRFCNVVDDRELSSAIMPAVIDRSPVLVAISTGGTSPVLATRLRQQLEKLLPPALGQLAEFAAEWREAVKSRFGSVDERRRFWQDTLDGTLHEQVLAGATASARQTMQERLESPAAAEGEAWIVGAGPGDPELMTIKAARLLGSADVILHDRLVNPKVLELARKDAEFIAVGKQGGKKSIDQAAINSMLIDLVQQGKRVCRLKGGDPFIFGRGGEEIEAMDAAGLRWQVVPGITAATGCAAAAGIPLTHRNIARSVVFATAHAADDAEPDWDGLGRAGQTVVFYMGLKRVDSICANMRAAGRPADLPALLIANGTTGQQICVRGTLESLPDKVRQAAPQSPALLIIGTVASLGPQQSMQELADELSAEQWLTRAANPGQLSSL